MALKTLSLDEVWWLVSPQNPLKSVRGMAPFRLRLAGAKRLSSSSRRIRASDIEAHLGSRYTADTLKALCRRFPRLSFTWLMGADNLAQIARWQRWKDIFRLVPIAVFDRPLYARRALGSPAARRFARHRLKGRTARHLAEADAPAWAFFHMRLDLRSATRIRAEQQAKLSRPSKGEENPVPLFALPSRKRLSPGPIPLPELHDLVVKALEDGRAEEIVTIPLEGKTTIADEMVIASARSSRQVIALCDHVERALAKRVRIAIEGKREGDWVLIDAGDVIVHIFRPEVRAYYNLEKMWGEALSEAEAAHQ